MSTTLTQQQLIRQAWLSYYNRFLLERGMITEAEYRRMALLIQTGKG